MKKITINKKQLILSLICDNLKNTRLIVGLDKLGLDAGKYHLQLSDTIFKLIGFKNDEQEEKAFEEYLKVSMKVVSMDVFMQQKKLEALALTIYKNLMKENKKQKSKKRS